MGLLGIAYEMPRKPPTVGWQLGIGHIVIVHREGRAKGFQGIVTGAWLDGSMTVMVPDLNEIVHCILDDLEVVGVMKRYKSKRKQQTA